MIRRLARTIRAGLRTTFRPGVPVWRIPSYWLDRLEERMDQREPNRSVSRSKVVRYLRAALGQFGPRGWIWAVLAMVLPISLVIGVPFWLLVVQFFTCMAWAKVGQHWTQRNTVLEIVCECECGRPWDQMEEEL